MSAPLRTPTRTPVYRQTSHVSLVRTNNWGEARILVIDDHQANVDVLKRILRTAGFVNVNSTTDPAVGVSLVNTWAPDLVLLDLHMPKLEEEQTHNQMWRTKLDVFGVDHQALYWDLTDYLGRFTSVELERMTRDVLAALTKDAENYSPGVFPEPPFPEPVLALYHHFFMTATYDNIDYWEHFACQSSVEMTIYSVVSATVLPGVQGNPELDGGPATLAWWIEHAQHEGTSGRTDEEKHLDMSRLALNRSETANSLKDAVVARADDALKLFAAAMTCQIVESERFPVEHYLTSRAIRTGTR